MELCLNLKTSSCFWTWLHEDCNAHKQLGSDVAMHRRNTWHLETCSYWLGRNLVTSLHAAQQHPLMSRWDFMRPTNLCLCRCCSQTLPLYYEKTLRDQAVKSQRTQEKCLQSGFLYQPPGNVVIAWGESQAAFITVHGNISTTNGVSSVLLWGES